MRRPASFLAALAALFLAGCSNYPMGMSKSEWEALTPGQRARYQQLQKQENADALHRVESRQPRSTTQKP